MHFSPPEKCLHVKGLATRLDARVRLCRTMVVLLTKKAVETYLYCVPFASTMDKKSEIDLTHDGSSQLQFGLIQALAHLLLFAMV